jgi:hypothetical protein
MHCIAFVQSTPTSPEIAILQLDNNEHSALHKNALQFVNEKQIFRKSVKSVEIASPAKTQTGLVIMVHLPGCAVAAYCDPI